MPKSIRWLLAVLGALAALSCHDPASSQGKTVLDIEADTSYYTFNRVVVTYADSNGANSVVVFDGPLISDDQLKGLPVAASASSVIKVTIQGFRAGHPDPVYVEVRTVNLASSRVVAVTVPKPLDPNLSGVSALAFLRVKGLAMAPAFDRAVLEYAVQVPAALTALDLLYKREDNLSVVFADNAVQSPNDTLFTVPFAGAAKTVALKVVAVNGATSTTYKVTLNPIAEPADRPKLKTLAVSAGTLSPDFSPNLLDYAVSVGGDAAVVTIMAEAEAPGVLRINGALKPAGPATAQVALTEGTVVATLEVIGTDQAVVRAYRITFTRPLSGDAALKSLVGYGGKDSVVFGVATASPHRAVPYADSSITFKAVPKEPRSRMYLEGAEIKPGETSSFKPLAVGDNRLRLKVVAENGDSSVYIVTVRRKSRNANLRSLVATPGILSPPFSPGVEAYAHALPMSSSEVKVAARAEDSAATSVRIGSNGFPGASGETSVPLYGKIDTVRVVVTAEDGNEKTYRLEVRRLSPDATLLSFIVHPGGRRTNVESDVKTFVDTVDNDVTQIEITPITADSFSTVTVNGAAVEAGARSRPIALQAGNNTVTLRVASEDGAAANDYTVNVYRARGIWRAVQAEGYATMMRPAPGGYLLTGRGWDNSPGHTGEDADAFVLKLDARFEQQWIKYLRHPVSEEGLDVAQTADGGWAIAGVAGPLQEPWDNQFMAAKIGSGGGTAFVKTVGDTNYDISYSVVEGPDNSLYYAGEVYQQEAPWHQSTVIRYGSGGSLVWQKRYPGWGIRSGVEVSDGIVYLANSDSSSQCVLFKIDFNGAVKWSTHFGGEGYQYPKSVKATADGGFIAVGNSYEPPSPGADYNENWENGFIARFNASGRQSWYKSVGTGSRDYAADVLEADGGFILVGASEGFGDAEGDVWLYKANSSGGQVYSKGLGKKAAWDDARSICPTPDGSYIIMGSAYGMNLFMMRPDANGNVR